MKTVWPKIFSILAVVAIMAIAIPSAVFAASPTIIDVTWDGSGVVTGVTTVGSGWDGVGTSWSQSTFTADGNYINGNYNVNTAGKTTYDVWGDLGPTTTASIGAYVSDGYTSFQNTRTGVSPYGINQHHMNPGQMIGSSVSASSDGFASFDMTSKTSSFSLANNSGGFNANANQFAIQNFLLDAPSTNFAQFTNVGSGVANIDCGRSSIGYSGAYGVDFGTGQGCSVDADVNNTGSGVFTLIGGGVNSVTTANGWVVGGTGLPASALYKVTATYGTSLTILDYSFKVR